MALRGRFFYYMQFRHFSVFAEKDQCIYGKVGVDYFETYLGCYRVMRTRVLMRFGLYWTKLHRLREDHYLYYWSSVLPFLDSEKYRYLIRQTILNTRTSMHTLQDEFEDTKWVIRIHKSKDKQHNGQKTQRSIKCHYIQLCRQLT